MSTMKDYSEVYWEVVPDSVKWYAKNKYASQKSRPKKPFYESIQVFWDYLQAADYKSFSNSLH